MASVVEYIEAYGFSYDQLTHKQNVYFWSLSPWFIILNISIVDMVKHSLALLKEGIATHNVIFLDIIIKFCKSKWLCGPDLIVFELYLDV